MAPAQTSPVLSVRKTRRAGAGRLGACQASVTQYCGQAERARLTNLVCMGDTQKTRMPRRAAWPGTQPELHHATRHSGFLGVMPPAQEPIRGSLLLHQSCAIVANLAGMWRVCSKSRSGPGVSLSLAQPSPDQIDRNTQQQKQHTGAGIGRSRHDGFGDHPQHRNDEQQRQPGI